MLGKRKKHILAVVFTVCLLILVHSSVLNSFFATETSSIKQKKQKKLVLGKKQKPGGVPAFEKPVGSTTGTPLYPQAISRLKKKSFKRVIMQFDLDLLQDSFEKCYVREMDLEQYNRGYEELYKFFGTIGSVFNFVASDVREKIDVLENHRKDENKKEHYSKIEAMMLHEIKINKETGENLFGSRTLLRLHRALLFIIYFLEKLVQLQPDGKTSAVALEAYKESLSKFHPWYIRNPAKLAMYSLPYKKDLMKKMVNPGTDDSTVKEAILTTVETLKKVYDSTDALYTKHDLHELP